jgi:pimeloyl-ACP methyl ester carboxylesterase
MTLKKQTSHIQADGHRLRVRTIEPAGMRLSGSPVLVFLHEGLGSIEIWRDFPEVLAELVGLPALVYDRYGSGGSEPLQEPRRENHFLREAEVVLPEVLAACGIDRPILVGHSDGGTIALLYAARYPDGPLGVITEAAHVFAEPLTLASIRTAATAFESGDLREKLVRFHGEQTESMFHGWADIWLSQEQVEWNIESALPAIICPMLVIQGEDDEYGTIAQVNAIVGGVSGKVDTLIIAECAHVAHRQACEKTVRGMAVFIESLLQQIQTD